MNLSPCSRLRITSDRVLQVLGPQSLMERFQKSEKLAVFPGKTEVSKGFFANVFTKATVIPKSFRLEKIKAFYDILIQCSV